LAVWCDQYDFAIASQGLAQFLASQVYDNALNGGQVSSVISSSLGSAVRAGVKSLEKLFFFRKESSRIARGVFKRRYLYVGIAAMLIDS
jgi:hypothetical protein